MPDDATREVLPLKMVTAISSPQFVGWFMLLFVVGILITGRFLWTRTTPPSEAVVARYVVDINQAEEAELLNLPEIGPSLAAKILRRRDELGEFRNIEDLNSVPGIGPQTLKQLAPYLEFTNSADRNDSAVVERAQSDNAKSGNLFTDRVNLATQSEQATGQ